MEGNDALRGCGMDSNAAKIFGFIDLIYEAALEPGKWPTFLEQVSKHFSDASTLLWHMDNRAGDLGLFQSYRYEQTFLRPLQDHYYAINPWLPQKLKIASGRLHRTDALYPERDLVNTEFYSDLLRPHDLFSGFGISIYNANRFAFLSILRSQHAGPPSEEELGLLRVLTPHMQRALDLHERFATLPRSNAPTADVLDALPFGLVLLGRDGRVVSFNSTAAAIFAQKDGFFLDRRGFCRVNQVALQKRFEAAIFAAMRASQKASFGAGGWVSISRPSLKRPYAALVVPVRAPAFDLGTQHIAAMLFISDPEAQILAVPDMMQQLYGLTTAEARLIEALTRGKRLEEAADELGISLNTAKTQMRSIFLKTDTSRQTQLIKLVLAGPLRSIRPGSAGH